MRKLFVTVFLFICLSANAVEKKTNFSEEVFENAKASGKTVVVNSYEVWCGTCSKQTKVLDQAEKEFKDIVFLSYEQSKNKNIAQKLGIKFWTTIVVYKGNEEVARIVGQTDKEIIYSAIQKGIYIMCPICWISGFIAVLFGGSFIATFNHPISWILGFGLIAYSFYKFYEAKKRGERMTNETKKRNKRTIFRFVQGVLMVLM